ncbi:hypothetical protein SRS16CHR_01719 [Variovorax sp. SRS16]|uniref:hypothetical protein n=1 Tax=Variovorax sp. SRS16 TaxID=282217 RepID=UPI001319281B|nr:hypothetical protein [Variovorax sp. SRS16]VTU16218.1 hypothetical protein SRS16CHR_01719 [Variovorax sp. SRS16]
MILVKTPVGQQAFKERSVRLTPRQRSAFILFDGYRSVNEVLDAGVGVAREDIDQLIELGLLGQVGSSADAANAGQLSKPSAVAAAPAVVPSSSDPVPARSNQQRYKDAYPIATRLTGSLGLRGFRLNLSVEGTSSYEELLALMPKIRAAIGPEKAAPLEHALGD